MAKAEASIRFDWGVALLTIWVVVGFYLDLWAHRRHRLDHPPLARRDRPRRVIGLVLDEATRGPSSSAAPRPTRAG